MFAIVVLATSVTAAGVYALIQYLRALSARGLGFSAEVAALEVAPLEPAPTETPEATPVAKKRRGRPPGSKNKPREAVKPVRRRKPEPKKKPVRKKSAPTGR